MRPYKHTKFKLYIKPVGEKSYIREILIENLVFTRTELESYLDYGKGNHYIREAQDLSLHGILYTWKIRSIKLLTDCDLGAMNIINVMQEVDIRKKLKHSIFNIETEFKICNAWLKPNGELVYLINDYKARHDEYAYTYLEELYWHLKRMQIPYLSGYEILETWGWIRILTWSKSGVEFYPYNIQLTNEQYKTLKDFCLFTKVKFPYDKIKNINKFE